MGKGVLGVVCVKVGRSHETAVEKVTQAKRTCGAYHVQGQNTRTDQMLAWGNRVCMPKCKNQLSVWSIGNSRIRETKSAV